MRIDKIKPIPKYMVEKIKKIDKEKNPNQNGVTRYYAYFTTNDKELVKVTVAVKNYRGKWHYKQCAVHGIRSEECYVKDMGYSYIGGYQTGWYSEGLAKYPKYYETGDWCVAEDKYYDAFATIVNVEYITKIPKYKYSACQIYDGADILQYLRLYEKYPQTEFLVKLGLSKYTKSKQILQEIEKDKRFRKWLSNNRFELSMCDYYISAILKAYQTNKPLQEVQSYERAVKLLCKEKAFKPIREMLGGDYKKYLKYTDKQQISNRVYLDYLNACNYLGLDMSEEKNRFPHDFKYWHDVRIDEYATAKALKDEEERKELYSKFEFIATKYSALQYDKKGEYVIFIAKSPHELKQEGDALNHCVGRMNYDQKFIQEQSLIFFVRNRENQEEPFVTVEYSIEQKKILQNYAKGNTKPIDTATEYLNKIWLPYANKKLREITS